MIKVVVCFRNNLSFVIINYSHLPNNLAADLINFSGKKTPSYTFHVGQTCIF